MNARSPFEEVLQIASSSEVGGGHNQKGVEFQRHWALMRMIELEESGSTDYLLLFEAVQDVAEFDSSTAPSSIRVYQVKKKDRNEWSWSELTGLPVPRTPGAPARRGARTPDPEKLKASPIGKLYASVMAFDSLSSDGCFISNAGCDLTLADGTNAATSLPCDLSSLSTAHVDLLTTGFAALQAAGMPSPDLSRLHIRKVALPVDALSTQLSGVVHQFLLARSPRHAGQAQALVDALLTKIGPLGAKTDSCRTFEELRRERGYSRREFLDAIGDLEQLPDVVVLLEEWFAQLGREGMSVMDTMSMKIAVINIQRRRLLGRPSKTEVALNSDCERWLDDNDIGSQLLPAFEGAYASLRGRYESLRKAEILAQFALTAIQRCVDPI